MSPKARRAGRRRTFNRSKPSPKLLKGGILPPFCVARTFVRSKREFWPMPAEAFIITRGDQSGRKFSSDIHQAAKRTRPPGKTGGKAAAPRATQTAKGRA